MQSQSGEKSFTFISTDRERGLHKDGNQQWPEAHLPLCRPPAPKGETGRDRQ